VPQAGGTAPRAGRTAPPTDAADQAGGSAADHTGTPAEPASGQPAPLPGPGLPPGPATSAGPAPTPVAGPAPGPGAAPTETAGTVQRPDERGGLPMLPATLLAITGGLATAVAFPPAGFWPLAAAGPALLVVALWRRSLRGSAVVGLGFGLAFFVPLLSWLINVAWYAWAALALAEAVVFAVFAIGQRPDAAPCRPGPWSSLAGGRGRGLP